MKDITSDTPHDRLLDRYERNRFFHGKLMTARDMQAEQHYNVDRLDTHTRFLAGSGIVCGLETTVKDSDDPETLTVEIDSGLALDCAGRQIVVGNDMTVEVDSPSPTDIDDDGGVHLYLHYAECVKERVPKHGSTSACETECEYNRVLEVFDLRFGPEPAAEYTSVPSIAYPNPADLADDSDDLDALFTMARSYYEKTEATTDEQSELGALKDCPACEQEGVFLGRYEQSGDGWVRDRSVHRRFAYTPDMLHAAIARHVTDFENPHWVGLSAVDDGDGVRLRVEGQEGDDGTVHVAPTGAVTVETTPDGIEIGADVDVSQLERDIDQVAGDVEAVIQYTLRRSLCLKRTAFSVVAERFAEPDIKRKAEDIVDATIEAENNERWENPDSYADFVAELWDNEEELGGLIEDSEAATDTSQKRYLAALETLEEALDGGDPLAIAAAQDCVSDGAQSLRPRVDAPSTDLVCGTFDDFDVGEQFDDTRATNGVTIEPFEVAEFIDDGPPEGRTKVLFDSGLDITVPSSSHVEIEVFKQPATGSLTLEAYNTSGSLVALETAPDLGDRETTFTFTVRAQNIDRLRLSQEDGDGILVQVCRL